MASSRRSFRSWLPRTRWGWVLCAAGLLFVLWHLPLLWRQPAFTGAGFFSFALVVVGGAWLIRLIARSVQRFMWAVRNRLLVTYFFLAAIPVLLTMAMFAIAGYIFYGQYSIYLLARDFRARVEQVRDANAMVVAALRGNPHPEHIERWAISTYDHYVFHHGGVYSYFYNVRGHSPDPNAPTLPGWLLRRHSPALFSGIIMRRRRGEYEVAAYRPLRLGLPGETTQAKPASAKPPALPPSARLPGILTISRLNQRYMTRHTGNLGVVRAILSSQRGQITTEVNPEAAQSTAKTGMESTTPHPAAARSEAYPPFPGSLRPLPPARNIFDQRIFFPATLSVVHWNNGHRTVLFLSVITRPSILNRHLFGGIDLDRRGGGKLPLTVLSAIGIFFILLELLSLLFGLRLTRTITIAVHDLYVGTQHVHRGDFEYRIPVRMRDQLADLENSFNTMTSSIRRLLREEQQKQRLESEIQIAQEVQAQLFPASAPRLPGLELAGRCLPARMVSGDFYDFLPLQGENDLIAAHPGGAAAQASLVSQVALVLGDVSGKGISAALLMATISSALRAYQGGALRDHESRRLDIPGLARWSAAADDPAPALTSAQAAAQAAALEPARILARLNNQLYHGTPAEKYATMFYALYDAPGRRMTYVNAGHPPPAILGPQGRRRLDQGGTVVGLFPELQYRQETVALTPGELLVVWSDGLSEPENEYGVEFGEDRLLELITRHQGRPLAEIIAHVLDHLREWCGEQEQPDDATLVLARAI